MAGCFSTSSGAPCTVSWGRALQAPAARSKWLPPTAGGEFGCVLQLFNALSGSLAISVDIVEAAHPPRRFLFSAPAHAAQRFDEELPIEGRDASPWCERSASAARPCGAACVACRREAAGPSEQPQRRERPRQRASPGASLHAPEGR